MREYFIVANSFAAPFFSDTDHAHIMAETPAEALRAFAAHYKHPAGLYAANVYESADAYHKGEDGLAQWLCNQAKGVADLTKDLDCYSMRGSGPGEIEINGVWHSIPNPKQGDVYPFPAVAA